MRLQSEGLTQKLFRMWCGEKRWCLGLVAVLALAGLAIEAVAEPARVLILNPFGRNVEPYSSAVSAFRSSLVERMEGNLDILEVPLDLARFGDGGGEEPLIAFLEDRISHYPVDLVVPIGGVGGQFADRHRGRLFPQAPVLVVGAEPRNVPARLLENNATMIGRAISIGAMIEEILLLQPQTGHIAVVMGDSALERFWIEELRREFAPYTGRIEFIWLNGLALPEIVQRCADLPPDSFIFHGLMVVDGEGVPVEANAALHLLHKKANAPVYAIFESEFGIGPVGGRLFNNREIGVMGAGMAVRILQGEPASAIAPVMIEPGRPLYDWRELRRWGLTGAALPRDSVIAYRESSFLERYRWQATGLAAFILFQSVLIFSLVINRKRRKRSELEASLVADISTRFVNLPAGAVDHEILEAERRLCEFLAIDLMILWQWEDRNSGHFVATHVYGLEAGPLPAAEFNEDDFPWVREQMLANRIVAFSSPDELPDEAATDRARCRAGGLKSNLSIPMWVGGDRPIGMLALNTLKTRREWPKPMVHRMQIIAQIFANALTRKRSDQVLRESETRLTLATQAAAAGLWELDLASGVFWASPRARDIFGFSDNETVTMERLRERVHPADWSRVNDAINEALTRVEVVSVEYRICHADGRERWTAARGLPLADSAGVPQKLTGLSFDITEQRRVETEVADLRASLVHASRVTVLGQLASSLAHELSQPLGAILRNAEAAEIMLRDPAPDVAEIRAIIDDILSDDHRAGGVINHLRSLLKRGAIEPAPTTLPAVVAEVLLLVHSDAMRRSIRFTTACDPGLPQIFADRIHLQQVLLNLIINAMDAMEDCAPDARHVRISADVPPDEPGWVHVKVADSGPGVDSGTMPRVFEPFFTSKGHGMGVGLPVCKTLVEAHKGRIWVENNPAGGACFCFTIPQVDAGDRLPNPE